MSKANSKFFGQKTNSEYPFARAFAVEWFRLNGLPLRIDASAKHIAHALSLECEGPGNGYAKRAVIAWHVKALSASKAAPITAEDDFYSSQAWRKARYQALRNCNGRCTLCGDPPGRFSLHVDHIKPRSLYPLLALDPSNLQVLCRDCNLGKSNTDSVDWRTARVAEDVDGEYSDRNIGKMLDALH
jgi:5-methylcytosine-specific restriction endonuclease McrA